ncbi:hypothetical protein ANANG_G00211870, partial [Anguilla anguilla]
MLIIFIRDRATLFFQNAGLFHMGENCVCVRYSCGNVCSVCSDNVIIFLLSDKACWCKFVMLHLYFYCLRVKCLECKCFCLNDWLNN